MERKNAVFFFSVFPLGVQTASKHLTRNSFFPSLFSFRSCKFRRHGGSRKRRRRKVKGITKE